MLLKNLLITTLWLVIPVTVVYASTPLCGSSTAVVENWKGEVIEADEMISTLEEPEELTPDAPEESISTLEYEPDLIVDEPDLIELETEE